jgi:predicted O-linked N-acetylglucosamine transferase (SPINDLY family)
MGVPVITLAGHTHTSRVGVSLLSNVGLKEFVAHTPDEYIEIAVNLTKNIPRLRSLRERLREMMAQSPLTDAKRFTANLETCYRAMWNKWCVSDKKKRSVIQFDGK